MKDILKIAGVSIVVFIIAAIITSKVDESRSKNGKKLIFHPNV